MSKKRFQSRLAAVAMFALLMVPFAAPASASAHEISCGNSDCGCCIVICGCNGHIDADGCGSTIEEEADADSATTEDDTTTSGDDTATSGSSSDLIRFNELLPNPVGTDTDGEFIELSNSGSADAEMSGWIIRNAAGKEFALPAGTLAGGGKLGLPYSETKIALTNGGMTLTLVGPDGTVQDSVTYPDEVEEGLAYAKSGENWLWTTTPTPGFGNVITVDDDSSADDTSGDDAADVVTDDTADDSIDDESDDTTDDTSTETTPLVRLSEIMPAPEGDDATGEWIELQNFGTQEADISGWLLDDAEGGSNPFTIPNGTVIPANGYLAFLRPDTKLALNNVDDSVRLFTADGTLVDEVVYDDAQEGEALAFHDSGWFWTTTPTPGAANAYADDTSGSDDSADDVATTETTTVLTVEQIHDVPNETRVTVSGVVTMPLGVVGATIFGIRDTDAEYGATIRIYASDRPDLQVGDIVQVDGTVRRKDSGELRLDTFGSHPVTILGSVETVDAPDVRIEDLDGSVSGLAVTVTGTVTDIGSNWFIITDEEAEREIKVELPIGSAIPVETGDVVSVSGIVRVERSVMALAVLDDADVISDESTSVDETTDNEAVALAEESEDDGGMTLPFLVVGALGAGGMAYRGLKQKSNNKNIKLA